MAFKVGSTTVVDDNGKVAASQLDITNATAESSIVGADEVLVYDASAGEIRKATITNSALVGPDRPNRTDWPDWRRWGCWLRRCGWPNWPNRADRSDRAIWKQRK